MTAKVTYHHGDLRNALVETATELVRAAGGESFSLRDAAAKLGVSANATYRHFDSKSALLTAVADVGAQKMGQKMRREVEGAERQSEGRGAAAVAIACFKATGRAYFAFAVEEPEIFRVMYGPHGVCQHTRQRAGLQLADPTAARLLGESVDRLVSAGIVAAEAREGGDVRAWTVFHGFSSLVVEGASHFPSKARRAEALEQLLDFTLRGLGASALPASATAVAKTRRSSRK